MPRALCGSRDVIAPAPEVIIPDPAETEVCTFTVKRTAIGARDYTAYKGNKPKPELPDSWYFLNKSGSKWGGNVCIEVENFVRGLVEGDPDKGQVMWRADVRDAPIFQQQLRSMGSPYAPPVAVLRNT